MLAKEAPPDSPERRLYYAWLATAGEEETFEEWCLRMEQMAKTAMRG